MEQRCSKKYALILIDVDKRWSKAVREMNFLTDILGDPKTPKLVFERQHWAGGVILSPRGKLIAYFSWSIRIATNNQAEAYALLKGLYLSTQYGIHRLTIFGDAKPIINHLRKKSWPK